MIVRVILSGQAKPSEYAFHRAEALLGSGRRADVRVPIAGVALRHARLRREGDRVWVEPLRSGQVLIVERVGVGRIKTSGPIALRAGDALLLEAEGGSARIELLSVAVSAPTPAAEHLFDLGDVPGTAPPPLLEAVTRFAVAAARVAGPADLRAAMSTLAQHFAVDAEVPSGIVLFGSPEQPPRWWVPEELGVRLRRHPALMTGADWRREVRRRLEQAEVLRAQGEGSEPSLVVVPLAGQRAVPGAWVLAAQRPIALRSLQSVAAMVSEIVSSALERLAQARAIRSLTEENRYFRARERRHYLYKELVTESAAMSAVYAQVRELLGESGPVWIEGEKGSGKEMLARALHHLSSRAEALMISTRCDGLEEAELDLELFGRTEVGAGGGAAHRPGLLELCSGGTLFLEAIEALPPRLQTKLCRVAQEREVRPEGATIGRPVDVRIIVSSEGDLALGVDRGGMRKDLYLQLAQSHIVLPPLRERREDIVPLADVFVSTLAPRYQRAARRVDPKLHEALCGYAWPGNARELQGYIELAIIGAPCDADAIERIPGLPGADGAD